MSSTWQRQQETLRAAHISPRKRHDDMLALIARSESSFVHRNTPAAALAHQRRLWATMARGTDRKPYA